METPSAEGRLVATPASGEPYSLEALLSGVTPENLHTEVYTGAAAGAEAW
jgi:antitoxin MazE